MHSDSTAIPVNLLKGKRNGKGKGKGKAGSGSLEELSPIAEREFVIGELCVELRDVVDNTQAFNEKKIIQSYAERVKDEEGKEVSEEEQKEEEEEEDEDEKPIYNPLNLPLGWDGKPIPYWLYKQYGLDKEYKCEICGNQSYWGRKTREPSELFHCTRYPSYPLHTASYNSGGRQSRRYRYMRSK